MTAKTLDGKRTAAAIKAEPTGRVTKPREQGVLPGLGTVPVVDLPCRRFASTWTTSRVGFRRAGRRRPMTRAMLLSDIVLGAEKTLADPASG